MGSGQRFTRRVAIGAGLSFGAGLTFVSHRTDGAGIGRLNGPIRGTPAPATRLQTPVHRPWTVDSIGTTALGTAIPIWRRVATTERVRVLVIGAIHGNEPVTRPIAESLMDVPLRDDISLHIIPTANPDGWNANKRRNARGIDLNRNFPWRWSPHDGGPWAGSALETQALMNTVITLQPDLAIWIHQPLAYVAPLVGCPNIYADAWVNVVGTRRRNYLDQHGGSETWCAKVAGVPSMLVEVSSWRSTQSMVAAHRGGFEACMTHVVPHR